MNAEIITIGNEILSGNIHDTNSTYISEKLYSIGIDVIRKTSVGDNPQHIENAIKSALVRADLVITSGGLGPTSDDITKAIIVKIFDTKLILDKRTLENIKARFRNRGIAMSDNNMEQAMVPANCEVLDNLYGTAPGIFINQNEKLFFAIPGVPFEMKYLLDEKILPILKAKANRKIICVREICTTGAPESWVGQTVSKIDFGKSKVQIGFYPSPLGTKIRLSITAKSEEKGNEILKKTAKKIAQTLGNVVYSTTGEEMAKVVGKILTEKGLSLAIAESCTGGLIGSRITDIPGSSAYFVGGIISYSNLLKMNILGVKRETLDKFGAVSVETAEEMARGARKIFHTDIGISVTGIAGPTGGTPEKPVGTVCFALNAKNYQESKRINFGENNLRTTIKLLSSQTALDMLRLYLIQL